MGKRAKSIQNINSLEKQLKDDLALIMDGKDYDLGIDIVNRSRELSDLYLRAYAFDKAIEVIVIMLHFCFNTPTLNEPRFIAPDIEKLIDLYMKKHNREAIIDLLITLIDKYPDYSNLTEWEKKLSYFKK